MIHLHENQNLLSSLDLAISMLFFPLWVFSQLTRHVPGSWTTKYLHDSDCCEMQWARHECAEAQKSALPCSPLLTPHAQGACTGGAAVSHAHLPRARRGATCTQLAKRSGRLRASWSKEGAWGQSPPQRFPGQPCSHVDQLMGRVNPRGKGHWWKGTPQPIFPSVGLLSRSSCWKHGKCICLSAQHAR